MEKVWIITIDEVCDYEKFYQSPMAFKNEDAARKMLARFKEDVKTDYADELKEGWVYKDGQNFCEVYNDGWYSQDHYRAELHEIELKSK